MELPVPLPWVGLGIHPSLLRRTMDHGVGILDTHAISCEVVLHDIHDCFIGVAVRPIAIALVLCVSNALFGVTYCTARGGTFEKSEPSPSAIVG